MSFYAKYAGIFGGGGGGGGGTAPFATSVDLSATDTSATVSFGAFFVAAPVVTAFLTSSNASADFIPIQAEDPTSSQVVVHFGTQIPDGTYTLHVIASVVND